MIITVIAYAGTAAPAAAAPAALAQRIVFFFDKFAKWHAIDIMIDIMFTAMSSFDRSNSAPPDR